MTRSALLKLLAANALFLSACDFSGGGEAPPADPPADDDGGDPPVDDGPDDPPTDDDGASDPPDDPPDDLPSSALPDDWFNPPADLIPGTSRTGTSDGHVVLNDDGEPVVVEDIRFPIEKGPAFANSQIFGAGGGGYDGGASSPETWDPVPGQENDPSNYDYPWRDNFCEVRGWSVADCPGGEGHQGQDIRPATCDNGAHWAVAPEDATIRNVGTRVIVNLFGASGKLHSMLHLERPLATNPRTGQPFETGDEIFRGERLGRISNMTSKKDGCTSGRCTSLHLHYEIWAGATEWGAWDARGTNPLPPYGTLVEAYLDLVDNAPPGEDWASPQAQPSVDACRTP